MVLPTTEIIEPYKVLRSYILLGAFFDVKEIDKYIFGKDIDVNAIKRGYHAEAHNEIFEVTFIFWVL